MSLEIVIVTLSLASRDNFAIYLYLCIELVTNDCDSVGYRQIRQIQKSDNSHIVRDIALTMSFFIYIQHDTKSIFCVYNILDAMQLFYKTGCSIFARYDSRQC